jgi:glycosyltransferase involved in cell wall biosynthesis
VTYDELTAAVRAVLTSNGPAVHAPAPEPELTVAMPAYNAGRFIRSAVMSVLAQTRVDLELIVVDDGSTDDTATQVEGMCDRRVVLLRNPRRRGIGFCHNRIVEQSRAPFIVHVDADDLILPGALSQAVAAVRGEGVGQAFSNHFEMNAAAKISRAEFDRQRDFLLRQRTSGRDLRWDLLVHGMVANPLRTYRKSALRTVGPFDESLRYAVDYEMTLRIADRFELRYIPAFFYCQRIHDTNTQKHLRVRTLRQWWTRARICSRLMRRRRTLLGRTRLEVFSLMGLGLAYALRLDVIAKAVLRAPRRLLGRARAIRAGRARNS